VGAISGSVWWSPGAADKELLRCARRTSKKLQPRYPARRHTPATNLALVRPCKNGFVARITDVTSKKRADACAHPFCLRSATNCLPLPTMNCYHHRLIGLEVYDTRRHADRKVKTVQNPALTIWLETQLAGSSQRFSSPSPTAAVPLSIGVGSHDRGPAEGIRR